MKILLVESDKQLAEIVSINLKSQNYQVELATDGQLGFELANTTNPDAAIVDCQLPSLSGFELRERLRSTGYSVPILMLAFANDVQDKIEELDSGVDDYLTKPFNLQELSDRLRALLDRENRVGLGSQLENSFKCTEMEVAVEPGPQPIPLSPVVPLWQQVKPKMLERLEVITQVIKTIEEEDLDLSFLQKGCIEAHKLAGTLGMVGFPRGTALARQIEAQFNQNRFSLVQLKQLLADLQRELKTEPNAETVSELATLAQVNAEQTLPSDRERSATILAVNDDPEFLDLLQAELLPWGFELTAIANSNRVLEAIETLHPHLMLLDEEMPGVNGIELCRAIRTVEQYRDIPLLILTSQHHAEGNEKALLAGADGFLNTNAVSEDSILQILDCLEGRHQR